MNEFFVKYLESIHMLFVLDYDEGYDVIKNKHGEYVVTKNGEIVDDRGALFASLRSAVVHSVPNVDFRSDPYIFMYYD